MVPSGTADEPCPTGRAGWPPRAGKVRPHPRPSPSRRAMTGVTMRLRAPVPCCCKTGHRRPDGAARAAARECEGVDDGGALGLGVGVHGRFHSASSAESRLSSARASCREACQASNRPPGPCSRRGSAAARARDGAGVHPLRPAQDDAGRVDPARGARQRPGRADGYRCAGAWSSSASYSWWTIGAGRHQSAARPPVGMSRSAILSLLGLRYLRIRPAEAACLSLVRQVVRHTP